MRRSVFAITALLASIAGISAGNALVERLDLDSVPDRTFMLTALKTLVAPDSRETLALQNAIYHSRREFLVARRSELETQLHAMNDYLAPLERDLQRYRQARSEQVSLGQQEQTRLYIDLVSRYRDHQRALRSLDTFVPLAEGETLLAAPSVYRDLIVREGGGLAETHNRFLEQPRDASFAARYEPPLRRFLADYNLSSVIVECRRSLCELHLSGEWENPYYRGFDALYAELVRQPWFRLERLEQAHQYRGEGVQIAVWMLAEGSL